MIYYAWNLGSTTTDPTLCPRIYKVHTMIECGVYNNGSYTQSKDLQATVAMFDTKITVYGLLVDYTMK